MYNEECYEMNYIESIGGLNKYPIGDEYLMNHLLIDLIKDDLIPEYSELFLEDSIEDDHLFSIIKKNFEYKMFYRKYNDHDLDVTRYQIGKLIYRKKFKHSFDVLINTYIQIENIFNKDEEL